MTPTQSRLCLGDGQLSALVVQALATAPSPPSVQDRLAAEIAGRYIALRGQQTVLVLLAEQENLDSRQVVIARRRCAAGATPQQPIAAAAARLRETREDQAQTRADIAALRVRLAVLTGAALGTIETMPGGPIPLPPAPPPAGQSDAALADYRAAITAAAQAQAKAMSARSSAARDLLRARTADTLAPEAVVAADRRALAALLGEARARAAMAQAYVVLARSPLRDNTNGSIL